MGLFDWFSGWLHSDHATSSISEPFASAIGSSDDFAFNPANGLPMIDGIGSVDVAGNPFGTDFSHDSTSASGVDGRWSSSSDSEFSVW